MQAIQGGILSRGTELLVCDLSGQLQGHKYLIQEIVGAQDASDDDSDEFLNPLAPGNLNLEDEGYYSVRDLQDCDEGDCRVHLLVENAVCEEASPHYPQDLPCVVERWVVELVVVVVVEDDLLTEEREFVHLLHYQRDNEEVQATEIILR